MEERKLLQLHLLHSSFGWMRHECLVDLLLSQLGAACWDWASLPGWIDELEELLEGSENPSPHRPHLNHCDLGPTMRCQ